MNTQILELESSRLLSNTGHVILRLPLLHHHRSPLPSQRHPTLHSLQPMHCLLLTQHRHFLDPVHVNNPQTLQVHRPCACLLSLDPVYEPAVALRGLVETDPREIHPHPALVVIQPRGQVHGEIQLDLVDGFQMIVVGVGLAALQDEQFLNVQLGLLVVLHLEGVFNVLFFFQVYAAFLFLFDQVFEKGDELLLGLGVGLMGQAT